MGPLANVVPKNGIVDAANPSDVNDVVAEVGTIEVAAFDFSTNAVGATISNTGNGGSTTLLILLDFLVAISTNYCINLVFFVLFIYCALNTSRRMALACFIAMFVPNMVTALEHLNGIQK